MSSTQAFSKAAVETPRTPRVEMKLDVVIPFSDMRNSARATLMLITLAAALVLATNLLARAQNCPPGYKIAPGACVQSCPGGYEDTGRICVYRRQSGGGGS